MGTEQMQHLLSVSWQEDHCLSYIVRIDFQIQSTLLNEDKRGLRPKKNLLSLIINEL